MTESRIMITIITDFVLHTSHVGLIELYPRFCNHQVRDIKVGEVMYVYLEVSFIKSGEWNSYPIDRRYNSG